MVKKKHAHFEKWDTSQLYIQKLIRHVKRAAAKNRAKRKRARLPPPPAARADARDDDARADERGEDDDAVVVRAGAFGRYGAADGAMSRADDEWATSERTWASLFGVLERNGYAKK